MVGFKKNFTNNLMRVLDVINASNMSNKFTQCLNKFKEKLTFKTVFQQVV